MNHDNLENHYASEGLRERVTAALQEAGLGSGHINWSQLAQLDQFHSRGLEAARELAKVLDAKAEDTVLDLGSGLGGPSRFLAATVGCHVTGIELTKDYVYISNDLTERSGLSGKVAAIEGDASKLTFDDETFDHAWTIHVSMNIQDKEAFYKGVYRVLRQGGRFAIYDILKGDYEPAIYPTPWSPVPDLSFLATASETTDLLRAAGFTEVLFEDDTKQALEALALIANAPPPAPNTPKTVTLPQVLGPKVRPMLKNMMQNFQEGRTRVARVVVRKD
jgi:ubiquinone/menaquinone biosynthesis C-methylase UbiE